MAQFRIGLAMLSLLLVCESSYSQKWVTASLPKDITIHKITSTQNQFWGVDYGKGLILNSPNGKNDWTINADLGSEYFEKIQFINEKAGFVCGDYGYVYKTTDGGKNWQEISPTIKNRITENFRGDSTKNQEPDGSFAAYYDMYFKNSQQGFVWGFVYNPAKGFRNSYQRLIFETKDGGSSWQPIKETEYEQLKSSYYKEAPKQKKHYSGTYYLNENLLWKAESNNRVQHISRSVDGGKSWQSSKLTDQDLGRFIVRSIVFINENEGYVLAGTLGKEPLKALVFHSLDGGLSWKLIENDWPHLHDAIWVDGRVWVSGRNGFLALSEIG